MTLTEVGVQSKEMIDPGDAEESCEFIAPILASRDVYKRQMYEDATTAVKLNGRESKGFKVKVGVHQGSVLSPLLFIIVLEALSRNFREGLPMELLYADDLVLMAETMEQLVEKINKWKAGLEERLSLIHI